MKSFRLMLTAIAVMLIGLTACDHGGKVTGYTSTQDLVSIFWKCDGRDMDMLVESSNSGDIGTQILIDGNVVGSTDVYPYKQQYVISGNGQHTLQIVTGAQYIYDNGEIRFTGSTKSSSVSKFMVNEVSNNE